jgi:hypothetical protein
MTGKVSRYAVSSAMRESMPVYFATWPLAPIRLAASQA